ncbi:MULTISPECIES: FAD binding domain-containing protein [Acidiphilium]|uniref:Xanthine dehydrogenase YagS FAD-binding subunit n=1 Tax=Acidiphilium rubrum TaxID=526 RepID=A0A8G2CIC9_ACIRU|nr:MULTISPECIES: xanthine dehydrogenase family protein subunit M [Acidiphilium]MBW4036238.1 xanthine dehydrogenase family protein subunit M [Pseudomonadota bacterium]SIQ26459.1 xanthine dehydrogenase YagS FAD-binding subunit [Acidiphilium rubrum]
MRPFLYSRATSLEQAMSEAAQSHAAIMAGGTTLVDLMRGDLTGAEHVIDIGHLPGLAKVELDGPVLRFGALARMADVAELPFLKQNYPALVESLQLAASQQIRNAATLGGNLLQRTRCVYFRDGVSDCNKRVPGSGCTALDGEDREMALFGASDRCVATYPGDWGTALAAFDTSIEISSAAGTKTVKFADFHVAYGDDPARESILQPGEIVTAILVQATPAGRHSTYVKVRDRQSYAYAVTSAAVALELDGDRVTAARVSLGGVASKPWRAPAAEAALVGQVLNQAVALEAGRAAFADAKALRHNGFKIDLGARTVARAAMVAKGKH